MEGEQNIPDAAADVGDTEGGAVGKAQSGQTEEVITAQMPSGEYMN